mmetsp:Transcript_5744/g.14977  ORF Transcript_5744/g.14977 Transcript_5744/m.14977 type:complete len:221 (-) Transcript_5744:335-997(-)
MATTGGVRRSGRGFSCMAASARPIAVTGEPCAGGHAAWPPAMVDRKRTFRYPFSDVPTAAYSMCFASPGNAPLTTAPPSSTTHANRATPLLLSSFAMAPAPRYPITSSSCPYARYTVRFGCLTPLATSASTAASCATTRSLTSSAPLPHTRLSTISPPNGSCDHMVFCSAETGTTSTCATSSSGSSVESDPFHSYSRECFATFVSARTACALGNFSKSAS